MTNQGPNLHPGNILVLLMVDGQELMKKILSRTGCEPVMSSDGYIELKS